MAEISVFGRVPEAEEIWRLDDRFISPPGGITLTPPARLEKSALYPIQGRHTWWIQPHTSGANEVNWNHYVPVPTKRYVTLTALLTPVLFASGDYLEVRYRMRTRAEEQLYKVQFLFADGVIKYYNYTNVLTTLTNAAPKIISGNAGEIEVILDVEARRYESVRIGRERFPIKKAGITGSNMNLDSISMITLVYSKVTANGGEIYLDHLSYSQS